jgi:predicted RNase H-like HicB family nuclease
MGSASRLTYPVLAEPLGPRGDRRRLARVSGLAGSVSHGGSPEELVAKGQDAVETWIEAVNDLGDLWRAIPRPSRRLVLDAAR